MSTPKFTWTISYNDGKEYVTSFIGTARLAREILKRFQSMYPYDVLKLNKF